MPTGFLVSLRMVVGLFFVVVSAEKLVHPYQNFLYVVQSYQVFPPFLEEVIARTIPWAEFFLGLFLVLGLWLGVVLRSFIILLAGFIIIVSQALIRQLPLDDCGCFGGLIKLPLWGTGMLDIGLLIFLIVLVRREKDTAAVSLDKLLPTNEKDQ